MTKVFEVPAETRQRQSAASHPGMSAWVSANAGSGKTHVLATRVIRLLLAGTDPSRILCLTYTRAAAANMANRVFDELSAWTRKDDTELAAVIHRLTGTRPTAEGLLEGRRLFARALETPGGLKIQTIHAFCEAVLQQFPLEANIAGHFEMLDGRLQAALFSEARRGMLLAASDSGGSPLGDALTGVLAFGESGLDSLLEEIVANRDPLRDFIGQMATAPEPFGPLFSKYGFEPGTAETDIAASIWPLDYFDAELAGAMELRAAAAKKKRALKFAQDLAAAIAERDPLERLEKLKDMFVTEKNGGHWIPRSSGQITSKGIKEHFPDFAEKYELAATRISRCLDRLALLRMLCGTRSALVLAGDMIERYEKLKSARGYLDFNDLINRTIRLLGRADVGPWIHYKLDRGIDHILVDEAQDTSPDQWTIINRLAGEFFTGRGPRDGVRTVFAVGDEKQSIYSFQGAAPEAFDASGRAFSRRARGAGLDFQPVELNLSFRSTQDVLSAVDRVFENESAHKGLNRHPRKTVHETIRGKDPGYVDIWQSIGKPEVEEPEDWTVPVDHASAPAVQLAERIATQIEQWIAGGEVIEGRGKKLSAGDVMVLVRKRDRFIHALSRGLKNRHIAVAGADRLNLAAHIAVKDLIALGRFVLQPEDDLSLAALLKSPIFDLSEERLFDLAWDRPADRSLFAALRKAAQSDDTLATVEAQLSAWRSQADFRPVYEFYADILSVGGVRKKLISRLGREAGDILDEFLRFAFAEEQTGLPGLEVFLSALETAGPDIKREMDQARDEVRIMTVHAAKGLEAPVVFLVDDGSAPFSHSHLPRLLVLPPEGSEWLGKGFLWRAGSSIANPESRDLESRFREKAEEEYRRLLYVGMTRAEDRLIVCGYHKLREPSAENWLSLVQNALHSHAEEICTGPEGFPAHRYRISPPSAETAVAKQEPEPEQSPGAMPPDLLAPVRPAEELPPPLAPSGAGVTVEPEELAAASVFQPAVAQSERSSVAAERGLAIHRLLQILPDLAEDQRDVAAARYVARAGSNWSDMERRSAIESALAVLRDSRFAAVFGPHTRAEVSVMGTLRLGGSDRSVSGKIDRLAVSPETVFFVDYKTNRPPARRLGEVPFAYIAQMALYRAMLKDIYPAKQIRAALLYTEAPLLIELPATELDNALARLT